MVEGVSVVSVGLGGKTKSVCEGVEAMEDERIEDGRE